MISAGRERISLWYFPSFQFFQATEMHSSDTMLFSVQYLFFDHVFAFVMMDFHCLQSLILEPILKNRDVQQPFLFQNPS